MDDVNIFEDVPIKELGKEELFNKIVKLKKSGLGWKRISEGLNKPKSTLIDTYNKFKTPELVGVGQGSEIEPKGSENSPEGVGKIIQSVAEQTQSVADLKEYIDKNCITNKELEHLKQSVEEVVNKRISYFQKQITEELQRKIGEIEIQ